MNALLNTKLKKKIEERENRGEIDLPLCECIESGDGASRLKVNSLESSRIAKKRKCDRLDETSITKAKKKKKKKKKVKKGNEYTKSHAVDDKLEQDDRNSEEELIVNEITTIHSQNARPSNTEAFQDSFSGLHYVSGPSTKRKRLLQELESKGITPTKGPWSTEEINKLHDNMIDFLKFNNVKDFKRLIIPVTPEDKKFRLDTDFVHKMCKGIKRFYFNIDQRVVSQYSNFLTKGKLSEDEKKELILLRKQGKQWKEIGLTINRHHAMLWNLHNRHSRKWNQGRFTKEEDDLLRNAVAKFSTGDSKRTWVQISEMVGTRSVNGCYKRWQNVLSRQGNLMEEITFTDSDCHKLVSTMYDSNFEDEHLIDWNLLCEMFEKNVTPKWLRWKWGVLIKEIPHSQYLEFPEIVNKLHELYDEKQNDRNSSDVDKSDVDASS